MYHIDYNYIQNNKYVKMSGWKKCQNGNNNFVFIVGLGGDFFLSLSFTILQFFWNVVNIMETMLSPSPLQELNEVMIVKCFFFVSLLSITSLYPYDLVLKEREWGLGGFTCLQKVFPGQGLLQFSLLSSNYVNLEPQIKCPENLTRLILGTSGTYKAKPSI